MSDVIAIIPARSGSKGVPDKNIKQLAGKPLLAYSIAAARATKNINRVIVSTDSPQYAEIAKQYGAETPFLRPKEFSTDNSTAYDFIKHALDWFQENENSCPAYLALLLPTTPLRNVTHIENAIRLLQDNESANALRSVHEMSETAYKTLEIDNGLLRCICSGSFDIDKANGPRQGYPVTYQPNGYVEVLKSSFILKNKKLFGEKTIPYITPPIVEVDAIHDFEFLEFQAAQHPEIIDTLFKDL